MANTKLINFDQLQSSMTKIKSELDKKANNNHGTHVTYYDDNPKVAGTTTAGSSSKLSRGDHVHPAQTTITGNAGTATTLATARTLTIGNTGKTFDGSANVSWSLNEIGAAAASHNHGLLHDDLTVFVEDTTTDNGWSMINSSYNGFILKSIRTGGSAPAWLQGDFSAGIAFGGADTKGVMSLSYSNPTIKFAGGNGTKPVWNMALMGTSGKTYYMDSLAANTANTLATARTLTIGNTGKSFNGNENVSWSLSEIGAQPANSLTTKTVSQRVLTLGTELYQYAAITSNNTIINLPSVSSFTEIHLFFDWPSGVSIIMPSNIKWQEGVMYGPGYTHEFIFTYVNSDIGWLGGCVVYG